MYQKRYLGERDCDWINREEGDVEAELSPHFSAALTTMEGLQELPLSEVQTPEARYRWVPDGWVVEVSGIGRYVSVVNYSSHYPRIDFGSIRVDFQGHPLKEGDASRVAFAQKIADALNNSAKLEDFEELKAELEELKADYQRSKDDIGREVTKLVGTLIFEHDAEKEVLQSKIKDLEQSLEILKIENRVYQKRLGYVSFGDES